MGFYPSNKIYAIRFYTVGPDDLRSNLLYEVDTRLWNKKDFVTRLQTFIIENDIPRMVLIETLHETSSTYDININNVMMWFPSRLEGLLSM